MNLFKTTIDLCGTPEEANHLFTSIFGETAEIERLSKSKIILLRDSDQIPVAAAAVESGERNTWYIWLFAVRPDRLRLGLGARLMAEIRSEALRSNIISLHLKTYRRFEAMRYLLLKSGWYPLGAELSARHDKVGELWQSSLLNHPREIVVIGANPTGRGGEWADRIQSLPGLWKLSGIVDLSESTRKSWLEKGVPVFETVTEMFDCITPAAVVIAVPPMAALKIQEECAVRGVAMLVEKPFASSLSELAKLQRLLTSHPVPLVSAVQRRAHPSYVRLRAELESERIQALSIQLHLGRPENEAPGGHRANRNLCRGGSLLDIGYHALDLVHFLLNRPLEMISCSLLDHGELARSIDSSAQLLGRCGPIWVRLLIDRHGSTKTEKIQVRTASGLWKANREEVINPAEKTIFQCSGSWELAEMGKLVELATACDRSIRTTQDLWEHLAAFEVIEKAYSMPRFQGLEDLIAS